MLKIRTLCLLIGLIAPLFVFAELDLSKIELATVRYENDLGEVLNLNTDGLTLFHKPGVTDLQIEKLPDDISTLLESFEDYSNVTTRFDPVEGPDSLKIHLIFELQKKRIVNKVRVQLEYEEDVLENILDRLQTNRGGLLNGTAVEGDTERIRLELVQVGFPKALVTSQITLLKNKKDVEVLFAVKLNSHRIKMGEIQFEGTNASQTVLKNLILTKEKSGYIKRNNFDQLLLEVDEKLLTEYFKMRGHVDVKVKSLFTIEDGKADVVFKINEGPRYKIQKIQFKGHELFNQKQLFKISKIKVPADYNERIIRAGLQKIREAYGEKGYSLSEVSMEFDGKRELLSISIYEGVPQVIERIEVIGNEKMNASLILKDFKQSIGDTVNTRIIKESIDKMKSRGYYRDVKIDYTPTGHARGKVVLTVEEASTQVFSFTGGMANSSPAVGLGYSNGNLFGTGTRLHLDFALAEEYKRIGFLFEIPDLLFGADLQVIGDVDRRERPGFSQDRGAFRVMVEKQITKVLTLGIGARLEFIDLDHMSEDLMNLYPNVNTDEMLVSGTIASVILQSSNIDTGGFEKNGFKVQMILMPSYADTGAYVRNINRISGTWNVTETFRGNAITVGTSITLGMASSKAPFFENFFLGGVGTIRGFDEHSLRPAGAPGGSRSFMATELNASFPLFHDSLRGVVFVEAIAMGKDIGRMGDVRAVGGAGIRANIGNRYIDNKLEFGFAIPFIKQDGDISEPFYVIFGNYDPVYDL